MLKNNYDLPYNIVRVEDSYWFIYMELNGKIHHIHCSKLETISDNVFLLTSADLPETLSSKTLAFFNPHRYRIELIKNCQECSNMNGFIIMKKNDKFYALDEYSSKFEFVGDKMFFKDIMCVPLFVNESDKKICYPIVINDNYSWKTVKFATYTISNPYKSGSYTMMGFKYTNYANEKSLEFSVSLKNGKFIVNLI